MIHDSVKPLSLHNLIKNDVLSGTPPKGVKPSAQSLRTRRFLLEHGIQCQWLIFHPKKASSSPERTFCRAETVLTPSDQTFTGSQLHRYLMN